MRLRCPLRILTADLGVFKRSARYSHSAIFARSSNAGACRRTFNAPSITPAISFLLARGCTRTSRVAVPSRICTSSIGLAPQASLFLRTRSKKRRSHADLRRALLDGHLKVVGHAHRENRQRARELPCNAVAQFAKQPKVRTHLFRLLEERRNAHQPSQ